MDGHIEGTVTASAYSQARNKLRHTAFKELSEDIVDLYYNDPDNIKLWKGYRLLGVDGSVIILPKSSAITEEFGDIINNHPTHGWNYSSCLFVCCYDVLNTLALSSKLVNNKTYESDVAVDLLDKTKSNDILIYDRGFCSYKFPATLQQKNRNFIIRCKKRSFSAFDPFFRGEATDEIVTLNMPNAKTQKDKEGMKELPLSITVRIIAVTLSTGEIEVLLTSLTDSKITLEDFKILYGLRWGIETFFGTLKGRLGLENFTGQSVESVKQDFWSTIFISNYETIVTKDVNQKLENSGSSIKRVNKSVAFNVIKHQAFNILYSTEEDFEDMMKNLEKLFMTGAVPVRENRNPPRKKPSARRTCGFLKRKKKHVY
jgi:hypothetical protein